VTDNVAFALQVIGKPSSTIRRVVPEVLELVGLQGKGGRLPEELSGGEQQRVAIARALASDPKLIIGDEPTGNLDTQTAADMFELLERLNDEGKTVVYVTHDLELAARAGRVVTIRDGLVVGE
jgi:cell division transport system ATP-binding protein